MNTKKLMEIKVAPISIGNATKKQLKSALKLLAMADDRMSRMHLLILLALIDKKLLSQEAKKTMIYYEYNSRRNNNG